MKSLGKNQPCRVPKCGNVIRTQHGQFLCQTHWRMVPSALKGKLFAARERAKFGTGKSALKAVEAEATRFVRDRLSQAGPKSKGGAA